MSDERVARRNYALFILQGVIAQGSKPLASPRLVLPYLYVALGAPIVLAGALMPLVEFSRLIAQLAAAPVVRAAQTRKWFLAIGWIATAAALAAVASAASAGASARVVLVFLLAALVLGVVKGLNTLAFNDLLARNLTKSQRSTLVFTQSALAGVVAIAIAWGTQRLSSGADALAHSVNLVWAGCLLTALAGVIIALVREDTRPQPQRAADQKQSVNPLAGSRGAFKPLLEACRAPWFRRYLLMRALTTSVILAMPFYAVHGAKLHGQKPAGLSVFVIATSLALIIGGPVWRRLGRRSHRLVVVAGACLTGLAGLWAFAIHFTPELQTVTAHALVFSMVAAGTQGVSGARTILLVNTAPPEELTYFTAVSNTISAGLGLVVAIGFGYIAHLQGAQWPVLLVAGLNFATAFACLGLAPKEPAPDQVQA